MQPCCPDDARFRSRVRLARTVLGLGAGVCLTPRLAAAEETHSAWLAAGWTGAAVVLLLVSGVAAAWWRERRKRRRLEERLVSANDRLRALFDESPLSICLFDPHDRAIPARIVECNQYACDLHGRTRTELVGRGMEVLTPLEITYEGVQRFLAELREGPRRGENPHRKKDGTVFYIEYIARRVVIDGREYIIGVDRDLSDERARKASEAQLRHTAELNQLVLRASNDGIWDWRVKDGGMVYSDRCREMLGYTAAELPDNADARWFGLLHPEDAQAHAAVLRRHWEEGAPYVFQFRARHKDGNWRWIISRGITLFDDEHRPVRMAGCRTDITELKRLDAELLQSRKLRAVGEMVGGIAHEFNNLLTPMLLHAELLEFQNGGSPDLVSHLGPIRAGIDRARELTQRILTFGRRSAEACEFLELEAVVRDNLKFLASTFDRRIRIEIQPPSAEPAVVWANRSDLNQLVVNLLLNARDTLVEKAAAAPSAEWVPQVGISWDSLTRASGSRDAADRDTPMRWHRLSVRDNGLGMSEEVRERVFEPFFTTKTVGKGTGLGLATAWHVSTAMGGWIDIESAEGNGTVFHVFLPAATLDAQGRAEGVPGEPASSDAGMDASVTAKPLRVLLVEDDDIVADATRRMIESFGHEVRLVADGQEAWDVLSTEFSRHDVVFTDLNLPRISGAELVRRLRGTGYAGRVVVYSGYVSPEHEAALKALNVDHILLKPFMRAQLVPVLG